MKRDGRSAVPRRAVDFYLRQRRACEVAAAYRRAYADGRGLGSGFEGWEREAAWPVEEPAPSEIWLHRFLSPR